MRLPSRIQRLDDDRLAARVQTGDAAAFEALYDRHHASLLAFCRHMLGNREDGEDALQQTFLRAHRALREGTRPDAVRPWLFAIARNRCRTMLAARRDAAVPVEELEPSFDGLAEEVRRRAELRELVTDLARLPDDQRGALVMSELGDLSHAEIATVIGCAPAKVKALVFQAREALIADRDARGMPCEDIRGQLESARGGVLRRGPLRRHLRQCDPCRAYQAVVAQRRAGLAWVLPVAPSAGLKAAVLGGAGASGAGGTAAAATTAVVAGGLGGKAVVATVAVTATIAGAGLTGGVVAGDGLGQREPAEIERARATARGGARPAAPRRENASRVPGTAGASGTVGAAGAAGASGTVGAAGAAGPSGAPPATSTARPFQRAGRRARSGRRPARFARRFARFARRVGRRRARRVLLRRLARGENVPPRLVRRLARGGSLPPRLVRRIRRARRRARNEARGAETDTPRTTTDETGGRRREGAGRARPPQSAATVPPDLQSRREERQARRERRREESATPPGEEASDPTTRPRRRQSPEPSPAPTFTPPPEPTPAPTATPEPTPTPAPTP